MLENCALSGVFQTGHLLDGLHGEGQGLSLIHIFMQGTYSAASNIVGPGIVDENGYFYDNANGGSCLLYTSRCV